MSEHMVIGIVVVVGLLCTAALYICCIAAGRADEHGTSTEEVGSITDDTKGENE